MAHILAEELDTALERQLMRQLRIVERALEKIEEGTYSIGNATGE